MGESNSTNVVREVIISQCSVSVEDWELKSQFSSCLFLAARCIGYFPRKLQWNMTESKTKLTAPDFGHELGWKKSAPNSSHLPC
jgi:hypothetical protein